jgi:acid stress-induced BolA-like protein IbaG/YrbA
MNMQADVVKKIIEEKLLDCKAIIVSDDNVHFKAQVISSAFAGKNRLARHQLVYATLKNQIDSGELHALQLTTYSHEEWERKHT